jgi:hypothetical protein
MGRASVDLFWIPLGAGHHSVRCNGIAYETLRAAIERRARCDLYHAVLAIRLDGETYWVEMTPVPDGNGRQRGVVAEGPVGVRALGRLRLFRYEIRRWRDGVVPDLSFAVASPIRVTDHAATTRRIYDRLPAVPTHVWGRDVLGVRDMWSCNSIVSWTLAEAGVDVAAIPFPPQARAPGWDAGLAASTDRAGTETSTYRTKRKSASCTVPSASVTVSRRHEPAKPLEVFHVKV